LYQPICHLELVPGDCSLDNLDGIEGANGAKCWLRRDIRSDKIAGHEVLFRNRNIPAASTCPVQAVAENASGCERPARAAFALLLDCVRNGDASPRRQVGGEGALVVAVWDGRKQPIILRTIGELELSFDLGRQPLPAERLMRRRELVKQGLKLQRSLDRLDGTSGIANTV
jgi:hypothetical protein